MELHLDRFSFFLIATLTLSACSSSIGPTSASTASVGSANGSQLIDTSGGLTAAGQRIIPVLDRGEDVALGGRFDTLTGQIISATSCLKGGSPVDRGSSSSNMRLVEVTDTYSQMKALDIDVSMQGSYLGASGNAKAKFVRTSNFSETNQNFLVFASAQRQPRTLDPPPQFFELTDAARDAIGEPADYNRFRKRCGDAFISTIYEGAQMFGMLTFKNQTLAQKKQTSGSMQASYGGWSASASANQAVDSASDKGSLELTVDIEGDCPGAIPSGDDAKARWKNIGKAAGELSSCAATGANPMSFKVIPYSSQFVRDWPFDDAADPQLDELLYLHAAYGAILDTINPMLIDRSRAYQKALLNRGVDLAKLDALATTIRRERDDLLALRKSCQSSATPDERAGCGSNATLRNTLASYTSPYVYRAQLPLSLTRGRPVEAFIPDEQLKQTIFNRNVQFPRDVACAQSDAAGGTKLPGCPHDFDQIRQVAMAKIAVHGPVNSRDGLYVFQTQSTGRNLCLVAPTLEKITTAATCDLKTPSKSQQRFNWMHDGLIGIRTGQCLGGDRKAVRCDAKRIEQLWRFAPAPDNPEIGRIQNGDGKCLAHTRTDKLVRIKSCRGKTDDEMAEMWKPIKVDDKI